MALFALTGLAQACPVVGDVATGVEVTYDDGGRSVITRNASGEVREAEYFDDTSPVIYVAANGVIETGYIDTETATTDRFTYSFSTNDLLPLGTWIARDGEQITFDEDDAEINRIPFILRTRGEVDYQIGDCTFRAIPLETYYYEPGEPSVINFMYLVDLKVPILVGDAFLVGGMADSSPRKPLTIRAVE